MNSKLIFAALAALMIIASTGCISIIKVPGENETSEGDFTPVDGFEAPETASGMPTKVLNEGELVSFPNLKATDPDGDPITYTFSEPLDENGEWQTAIGDAGRYTATITASDGTSKVSQDVLIIVNSLNKAPVIEAMDDIVIEEGETVLINPVISDADGDNIEVVFSGWMDSSKRKTGYDDAGTHPVIITASDGREKTTQTVNVIVNNVDRQPAIDSVEDIEVEEGDFVSASVEASDPDGDELSFSFSEPLDENGEWQTAIGDAGKYMVRVTASDGELEAKSSFYVTVRAINLPPVLSGVEDIEAGETDVITLSISAEDPEGEDVSITFSEPFDSEGVWATGYDDAGEYVVTVVASDGVSTAEETFTVAINDMNRPPTFAEGAFE